MTDSTATQPLASNASAPEYGAASGGGYQQVGAGGAQVGGNNPNAPQGSNNQSSGGAAGALADANTALSPGYSVNLFDCCNDPTGCLITCCCPFLPLSATKAALDERQCTLCDCFCGSSPYQNRQTLRSKYKKGYSPASDCVAFCCCPVCAIVQDVQELARMSGKPADFVNMMRA